MARKKQGKVKITNIPLTDEQRTLIERTTGVALKEISVLEQTGVDVQGLRPNLVKTFSTVMGW